MSSIALQQAEAAWDAIDAAVDELAAFNAEALSASEHRRFLDRQATAARRLAGLGHQSINWLAEYASTEELGGSLRNALADLLRVTQAEAGRLIAEAQDLGPRQTLTGEPLPARLEATAAGQAAGEISAEQVRIIRGCLDRLPYWLDEPTRAEAERQLAAIAAQYRPDELRRFAE
ncbi:MAG: hypothetical protein QOH60_4242, partial [Mycobacterium sp.]|nr:hypothetical protein [Mycobacterium sp.]